MAFVQAASDTGSPGSITLTSVAAGSTIVVWANVNNESRTLSVSDDVNGSGYSVVLGPVDHSTANMRAYCWVHDNVSAGTTVITISPDTGSPTMHTLAAEYSGRDTTSAVEDSNSGENASGTSHTDGSVTATTGADVAVGLIGRTGFGGCTPDGSYTERHDSSQRYLQDQNDVSAGSISAGTVTSTNSRESWMMIVSLKKAGAAAGQPTMRRWGGTPGMLISQPPIGRSWT